tara:strand:- start:982 stop:1398 length:417 start_codon:yes stop_codon:yes gene_type:complete
VPKKGERDKRIKKCEVCRIEYHPAVYQFYRQKYCSLGCKEKKRAEIEREKGIFKGGYSRQTYIRLWVDAMGKADTSAPCHYCGKPLYPDNFVVEHRKPRSELSSRDEMTDISNLVVSCHACNKEKGLMSYEEFKCLKN